MPRCRRKVDACFRSRPATESRKLGTRLASAFARVAISRPARLS